MNVLLVTFGVIGLRGCRGAEFGLSLALVVFCVIGPRTSSVSQVVCECIACFF